MILKIVKSTLFQEKYVQKRKRAMGNSKFDLAATTYYLTAAIYYLITICFCQAQQQPEEHDFTLVSVFAVWFLFSLKA